MRILLATVPVVVSVLLIGSLADFHDPYSNTAFELGVFATIPGFLIGSWLEERWRGRAVH